MIFLWTTSDQIGSRLIKWGLEEDCSHFALAFFEHRGRSAPLIESKAAHGVKLRWLGDFLEHNKVVHALKFPFESGKQQADLFHHTSSEVIGIEYDKRGIAYWAIAGALKKFFGRPIPMTNKWGRNEQLYCVEIIEAMEEFMKTLGIDLNTFDLEMTSPHMAYHLLKDNAGLTDVTSDYS